MYQAYWGLGQSPFRGNQDPRFFFQGITQEEALARLHFLVDERRTLGLLLGPAGTGKSQLLEVFAKELSQVNRQLAIVQLAGVGRYEFLWVVAGQLGVEASIRATEFALSRILTDHLSANRYQQISTILLLDDADLASTEVLTQIGRLTQLDVSNDARLTILLSSHPQRLHKLGSRLVDLADLRIDLDGWEADETAAFVKQSLALAGRSTPIFSEAALQRLHDLSQGVPRRVKQLADLALMAGAGLNLVQIEPDTILAVHQELGVTATSEPAGARHA